MSKLVWSRNRRGIALAVSAAVFGFLGYLVYEAYLETTQEERDGSEASDVEDVLLIDDHDDDEQQAIGSPRLEASEQRTGRAKQRLVVSARGIVVDSIDRDDRWSGRVRVRQSAASVLARLAELYELFVVVVVRPGSEHQVLETLAERGIIGAQPLDASDIGESVVWVNSADESSVPSGMSSQVSSILGASPGILPRSHVLFCETEEGKIHLARHLLTSNPPTPHVALGRGYAGYADTNGDVVARLAQVLHKTVLVIPGPHDDPQLVISGGEVPGLETALALPPTAGPVPPPSETVVDLANSSLY